MQHINNQIIITKWCLNIYLVVNEGVLAQIQTLRKVLIRHFKLYTNLILLRSGHKHDRQTYLYPAYFLSVTNY